MADWGSFIDLQLPENTHCPPAPYLAIPLILTPDGAHLSRPVRADGDLWGGAPAVSTWDRQQGPQAEAESGVRL